MTTKWVAFSDVPQFSYKDVAYTTEKPELRPFYAYEPSMEGFAKAIADRKQYPVDRTTLVEVLEAQYADLSEAKLVNGNIQSLRQANTFTVITAHQPSLFTGPLYYIYKIISTIHLCQKLAKTYPDYQFVPVFVTGGEDHDFEEVNYVNLFGRKVTWENDLSGSVGMMPTESLRPTLDQLQEILGTNSERAVEIFELIERVYTQNKMYSKATVELVHELFKTYGLVVANMNHSKLKRLFIPHIKEEIFEQPSQALVQATADKLNEVDFKLQAFPREINFFYLRENLRERIVFEDGVYKVLNTNYTFTKEELSAEIDAHPEFFSPNVVMRPIYQEAIMPNLAYVGGGGELAYWLERKAQFTHFKVFYPMLIRRNSVMWLDKGATKKMRKLDLHVEDLFQDTDAIIRHFVENQTTAALEINEEKAAINRAFDQFAQKGKQLDPTLAKAILAEKTKVLKTLGQLEGRLLRSEKQKHEVAVNQIGKIKESLFPNNGLQERYDNFLGLYIKYGRDFFDFLLEHLNPLEKKMLVVIDD
ncbi:MAG: bacillithiol biosynthesis cysteine-adding enzyme BshC [Bacteroidota bacterium]